MVVLYFSCNFDVVVRGTSHVCLCHHLYLWMRSSLTLYFKRTIPNLCFSQVFTPNILEVVISYCLISIHCPFILVITPPIHHFYISLVWVDNQSDWFRDRHLTQCEPIKVFLGILEV